MSKRLLFVLLAVIVAGLSVNTHSTAWAAEKKSAVAKTWKIGAPIVTYWASPPMTDAIAALMEEQQVFGYEFEGTRYDAGTTMGWLKASVEIALARPDLGAEFRAYLHGLQL